MEINGDEFAAKFEFERASVFFLLTLYLSSLFISKQSPGFGGDPCPQYPNRTKPAEWKTIFEEYVLRDSNPEEYFYDNVVGFLIDKDKSENMYYVWYSNEVGKVMFKTLLDF